MSPAPDYTTAYPYDNDGNLHSITCPGGSLVVYERNSLGQVIRVTSTVEGAIITLAEKLVYLPFGPLQSFTYG